MVETLDGPHAPKLKPSIEEPPTLELKTLPSYLKYAFLKKDSKLPIVISSSLTNVQKEKLLRVLREHKKSLGWTITDIKGIALLFVPTRYSWKKNVSLKSNPKED